jgi:hypothetical protein
MAETDRAPFDGGDPLWGEVRGSAVYALPTGAEGAGGAAYGPLLESFRLLQDRFSGAALPEDVERQLAAEIDALNERLLSYQVPEAARIDARRPDLPGRGSPVLPPFVLTEWTDRTVTGHVTFRRFHLGGNGAAHGGTQPLVFDDVLGRAANHGFDAIARTGFLTVNYRKITPIGVQLQLEASVDKVDGRKRWASGRLLDDSGTVLCDANGLFIELLPGQP